MLKRILNPPSQSFFLLGPRGTGKSTWLRALFPDAHVIDLLSEATYQGLLANPGLFANQLRAVQPGKWVVIDEVQRVPALLNEVHRFKDYRRIFDEMYYWAPAGGVETEVDFLLLRNREFVAVEVKSGRIFSEKWCKGLRAIAELKGLQRRIVVYPLGPVLRTEDGIDGMPFDYFANLLAENRL